MWKQKSEGSVSHGTTFLAQSFGCGGGPLNAGLFAVTWMRVHRHVYCIRKLLTLTLTKSDWKGSKGPAIFKGSKPCSLNYVIMEKISSIIGEKDPIVLLWLLYFLSVFPLFFPKGQEIRLKSWLFFSHSKRKKTTNCFNAWQLIPRGFG